MTDLTDLTETHDWVPTSTEEATAFDEWLERYDAAAAIFKALREEGAEKGWAILHGEFDHISLLDGRWVRRTN